MSERTEQAGLAAAFAKGRPALVAYLMGGYPDRDRCLSALRATADGGADLIELGVPYGDPMADGRVIRDAGYAAMATGFGLIEAIDLAAEFVSGADVPPVALMTYYNPMLSLGLKLTAEAARSAGVSGFIIPDLPADASDDWLDVSEGLDTVFLVAPTSTADRVSLVAKRSAGFVYAVSSIGLTGQRATLSDRLPDLVRRVKDETDTPVAVGFGIGTPEKAAEVAAFADGVVVGSAIVKVQDDPAAVRAMVETIATAVHEARTES